MAKSAATKISELDTELSDKLKDQVTSTPNDLARCCDTPAEKCNIVLLEAISNACNDLACLAKSTATKFSELDIEKDN